MKIENEMVTSDNDVRRQEPSATYHLSIYEKNQYIQAKINNNSILYTHILLCLSPRIFFRQNGKRTYSDILI